MRIWKRAQQLRLIMYTRRIRRRAIRPSCVFGNGSPFPGLGLNVAEQENAASSGMSSCMQPLAHLSVGAFVGGVGARDGPYVGSVGDRVGLFVLGDRVGKRVGSKVGVDGDRDGAIVGVLGEPVGLLLGAIVGVEGL